MRLCLDTNAYARFREVHLPLIETLEDAEAIDMSAIVLGELHAGFELGTRAAWNRARLAEFLAVPSVRLVVLDGAVAERYGALVAILKRQGTPLPANDIWIAASALETGARLVTYDRHFDRIPGLMILAP